PVIQNKKISRILMVIAALFVGAMGSSIVQGIGWEPLLKFLNHASFDQKDPYFHMDISFYMFILPFVKMIIYILLGLCIFFLAIVIGAYSVFHIYRMSRSAKLHLGVTLEIIRLLIAGIHVLAPYETLLTNKVNIFRESVVHGLSYTDKMINIPDSYILAAVAVIAAVWMFIAVIRGIIITFVIPVCFNFILLLAGQGL